MDDRNALVLINSDIQKMEDSVKYVLQHLGLPSDNIFTDIRQRFSVFKNIEDVLMELSFEMKQDSKYISKFFAAVAAGLFDAALNYLWDETITQLRNRIAQYDIEYFFDCAIKSDKRSKLTDVEDLIRVDDSELLYGAKEIGLISSMGYKLLEQIKFMRNWASAAHPNNSSLTGLQLVSWLETCIKEVICLPLENITVRINTLLENIKKQPLDKEELKNIVIFFQELPLDKIGSLSNGLFGMFTRTDTPQHCIDNIIALAPDLWKHMNSDSKLQFGIRYAQYGANGDKEKQKLAKQFLEICGGLEYIPDSIRDSEINEQTLALRKVHVNFDNFYNEGMFAKQLMNTVGGRLPDKSLDIYVETLVYVYISNGYGVASSANSYYEQMILGLDSKASMKAVVSFLRDEIANKLEHYALCRNKYKELLDLVTPKITSTMFLGFIQQLRKTDLRTASTEPKILSQIELLRKNI